MNAEHIQRAAADWLAKRMGERWTAQNEAEFDRWIDADIAHRIQYVRIEAAWHHAARLKALGAGVPAGIIPPRATWGDARYYRGNVDLDCEPAKEMSHEYGATQDVAFVDVSAVPGGRSAIQAPRRVRYLALAASVLVCVLASGYAAFSYFAANHYSTAIGAVDTVPLRDGSHVTLNTNTSIHVDLGNTQRLIELEKGEAYFEVAKDPHRPFIVQAGHKRVIAVGTKFSVRRDHDDVQVAVTEGKVRLEEDPEPSPAVPELRERRAVPDSSGGSPVFLTAGAIARATDAHVDVDRNAMADADRILAWRRGYVTFDNTPLSEAVAELNRYNVRKIAIQDPALADIRIGGSFRATNTDAFLELLRGGHSILVERREDGVILKAR